jgi:alpha-tubulin suppressor-like RCC1 family protein
VIYKSHAYILENSGEYRHYCLGYREDDLEDALDAPESTAARLVANEELDHLFGVDHLAESIHGAGFCVSSRPTVLESGSVVAIATNRASSSLPGCIYAETVTDLQTNPVSCWHKLPGPPETSYQVATGLAHAILLSQSANPGFNQVLGLGDNRHRAANPTMTDTRQPPNHLSGPRSIEDLCGIAMSGISAGGSRSAAWSSAGEGWIWGKGIEGLEAVELPFVREADSDNDEEDEGSQVSQIAVGDGYELVLTRDGSVWVRGNSTQTFRDSR